METELKNNRYEWVDLCKFIGIVYMVWSHSGVTVTLDKYIHVFHMPIFFFLSGFVFNIKRYDNFISFLKKKSKTLLIPYFTFSIICFCFWTFFYRMRSITPEFPLITLVKGMFTYNTITAPYGGIQWFLTCLFLVEIMFFIVRRISGGNNIIVFMFLAAFSLIGFLFARFSNNRLPWGLDTAFTAIVFYGIGNILREYQKNNIVKSLFYPRKYVIPIFFVISILATYKNSFVNLRTIQYGSYALFYTASLVTILMYIQIAILVSKNMKITNSKLYRICLYIGQNTLIILVLNQMYIQLITKAVRHYISINRNTWGIFCTLIVITLMIPTSYVINNYLPFLLGKTQRR